MSELRLVSLEFSPLDVELVTPFGIATGAQQAAENVLIRLELSDGTVGWGEAAPFPAVSGETRDQVLECAEAVRAALESVDLSRYRDASHICRALLVDVPSALGGVEIALLDAFCRHHRVALHRLFGGAETSLVTDMTIVTGSPEEAAVAAKKAADGGFEVLKVKVGGGDVDDDVRRLQAIFKSAPSVRLLLDANGAFDASEALFLLSSLADGRPRVFGFEQPTARDDIEGLGRVERDGRVPVIADESLRGSVDLQVLARAGGISAVNIKTAKLGLVGGHDMMVAARGAGFDLMIGGMVETELSMSASACLASGLGGVKFVDLDTHYFMGKRPLTGGFVARGPHLDLAPIRTGHGVTPTDR